MMAGALTEGLDEVDVFMAGALQQVRVNRLINAVRSQRPQTLQCPRVLMAKDSAEPRFLTMLTEDRTQTAMSYVEFLCHIHRQIQAKFT